MDVIGTPGLTEAQRFDWLRLIRSENVGPRTFRTLINRFGGAGPALAALPDLPRGSRPITIASVADCERERDAVIALGGAFVTLADADYPPALKAADAPPPVLIVCGNRKVLGRAIVAIVGSRNASAAGLVFTERLAGDLGRSDYVIASGLARGIDARAHRASLSGGTIAVLAGGLDRIYPHEHAPLRDEILANGGVVLSEMPMGWEPRGRDFPRRNRVVAGLALGTVVVEAARRSGSLITARFANEMGREVFAVPGSPLDPRAEGTNDLIAAGATLCRGAADVSDALAPLRGNSAPMRGLAEPGGTDSQDALWDEWDGWTDAQIVARVPPVSWAKDEDAFVPPAMVDTTDANEPHPARILSMLGPTPLLVDDVIRAAGLPAATVMAVLLDLEIDGHVVRQGSRIALATSV